MDKILDNYSPKITYFKNTTNIEDNILNNYPIYVINLKTDITRKIYIHCLFKKEKINYHLIEVERIKNEEKKTLNLSKTMTKVLGCAVSHLWCIQNAVKQNLSHFIIFEDDIIFHKNYQERLKICLNYNAGLLMLGACDFYFKHNLENSSSKENIYYPSKNALGGHANLYSLSFAKIFLNYKLTNEFCEFDTEYEKFYNEHKICICYPNLVITELTTTNNFHNYSPIYRSYLKYRENCFDNKFTLMDYKYITIHFIEYALINKYIIKDFNKLIEKYCKETKYKIYENLETVLLNNGYSLEDIRIMAYNKNLCNSNISLA
jgi:GR25 family glycosyltransferase involved in LPS biosynthesis